MKGFIMKNSTNNPWLSVVIPIYNAGKYLRKCLNSILNQSFESFEVLMVDDGSSDNSGEICVEFSKKDSRFKYLQKENGGSFDTRLYGASLVKGTYFTFCDADDYYSTKKVFETFYNYLSEEKFLLLQYNISLKYNFLNIKKIKAPCVTKYEKDGFMNAQFPALLCNKWEGAFLTSSPVDKVYHRKLLQNLPIQMRGQRIFWGDDLIMNLYLLENCESSIFIPDALYSYRQSSGGTARFSKTVMYDLDKIKENQKKLFYLYDEKTEGKIKNIHYSETAAWLFLWAQQAIHFISADELKDLINKVLNLPAFIEAKTYYLTETDEKWEAVDLLRVGNADEYVNRAISYKNQKVPFKAKMVSFIKRII